MSPMSGQSHRDTRDEEERPSGELESLPEFLPDERKKQRVRHTPYLSIEKRFEKFETKNDSRETFDVYATKM
eukprot:3140163-Pyramimonas_sp.AAC.1